MTLTRRGSINAAGRHGNNPRAHTSPSLADVRLTGTSALIRRPRGQATHHPLRADVRLARRRALRHNVNCGLSGNRPRRCASDAQPVVGAPRSGCHRMWCPVSHSVALSPISLLPPPFHPFLPPQPQPSERRLPPPDRPVHPSAACITVTANAPPTTSSCMSSLASAVRPVCRRAPPRRERGGWRRRRRRGAGPRRGVGPAHPNTPHLAQTSSPPCPKPHDRVPLLLHRSHRRPPRSRQSRRRRSPTAPCTP